VGPSLGIAHPAAHLSWGGLKKEVVLWDHKHWFGDSVQAQRKGPRLLVEVTLVTLLSTFLT
jgi:hypothetical protein